MNYHKIYFDLINKAQERVTYSVCERHHIVPRSLGGEDTIDNIVLLTIQEHYVAHLLLYKMGYKNQIFSAECFLLDSLNINSRRYKKIKYTKWVRRKIAHRRAELQRELQRDKYFSKLKLIS